MLINCNSSKDAKRCWCLRGAIWFKFSQNKKYVQIRKSSTKQRTFSLVYYAYVSSNFAWRSRSLQNFFHVAIGNQIKTSETLIPFHNRTSAVESKCIFTFSKWRPNRKKEPRRTSSRMLKRKQSSRPTKPRLTLVNTILNHHWIFS